jgi:ABC-type protease/lipase transport system fused ATPase/permease subunit
MYSCLRFLKKRLLKVIKAQAYMTPGEMEMLCILCARVMRPFTNDVPNRKQMSYDRLIGE